MKALAPCLIAAFSTIEVAIVPRLIRLVACWGLFRELQLVNTRFLYCTVQYKKKLALHNLHV